MNNKVYIVQKWIKDLQFEFCGVFTSEEKALAACIHKDCYIAPAILDEQAPEERVPWPGLYYPHHLKEMEDKLREIGCIKVEE